MVTDTITGAVFEWGRNNFVRLDPFTQPAHILHVTEVL
jgi:starch synthase (maltosyl-transferring)